MNTMYIIDIEKQNLDLITFLNNGVQPKIEDKPTVFLCLIISPTENSTAIMVKDDLYDEKGNYKDPKCVDWVTMISA